MMIRPNDVFPARLDFAQPKPSLWPGEETGILAAATSSTLISILMSTWHDPTPLPEKLSQIVKKRFLELNIRTEVGLSMPNVVITSKP